MKTVSDCNWRKRFDSDFSMIYRQTKLRLVQAELSIGDASTTRLSSIMSFSSSTDHKLRCRTKSKLQGWRNFFIIFCIFWGKRVIEFGDCQIVVTRFGNYSVKTLSREKTWECCCHLATVTYYRWQPKPRCFLLYLILQHQTIQEPKWGENLPSYL